ncbi:hypothetical protein SAMN05421505_1551 [Sinosporangium album]|uniref:Uncharacterized protein n=1 Tax=Sinosporangium album TaxID=504805 RepID=A0A1G8KUS4_9ACTN|nr:hypothetical protein [Sinosporangium album]SDI46650.1 hypothetical protein SAMN05421505_1551 [Sinosporangium album]
MPTTHYLPAVTIRLAAHETEIHTDSRTIRVLIPGLMVVLRDQLAAWGMWHIWQQASGQADTVFNGRSARYEVARRPYMHTAVSFTGRPSGVEVYARHHSRSRTGCGELAIRVGPLTIVTDDRSAYDTQAATWAEAAELAAQVWPGRYQQ